MSLWGCRPGLAQDFEYVRQMVKNYNDPGRLVTFLGYEWTGDRTRWGDHNVFYFDDNNPLDLTMDLPELCDSLRQRQGIAIPHHTGYQVGERGKDWDCWDEELSPFAEIFSCHGSSEGCNTPLSMNPNASMAPRISGGTIQDGLARGYRRGIIASGDNPGGFPGQWGTGLMGVYAEELTREAVWEAFKQRRVYAVTGDRIRLDFGWGPIAAFGFAVETHHWEGHSAVSSGSLQSIEGCFSCVGNRVEKQSSTESRFHLGTEARNGAAAGACQQTIILEIEGNAATGVQLEVNGKSYDFALGDLVTSSHVFADSDQVKESIGDQFGLNEAEIENRDVYWHNAYKVELHQAIPQAGYTASFDYRDETAPSGRNFYYVRVSQLNGQMGWASPIWMER